MHRRFLDVNFHLTFDPKEVFFVEIPQEAGEPIICEADEWDRRDLAEQMGLLDDLFDNLN